MKKENFAFILFVIFGSIITSIASEHDSHDEGIIRIIKKAHNAGMSLSDPLPNGNTLLATAVELDMLETVEELIDIGANSNSRNSEGVPLIILAVQRGNVKTLAALLKGKLDINSSDCEGKTAIFYAETLPMVKLLLKKGARVDIKAKDGSTALTGKKHLPSEFSKTLIKAGADTQPLLNKNATPLMRAVTENNLSKVKKLIESERNIINKGDAQGWTALMYACKYSDQDIVEALMKNDANVNANLTNGLTPLKLAVERGDPNIVKMLLDDGAKTNVTTDDKYFGANELFFAWSPDFADESRRIVKLLLKHGADVNALSPSGETVFSMLVNSSPEWIDFLCDNHADINKQNVFGQTPLMKAASLGKTEAIIALMHNNALTNMINENNNLAALDYAKYFIDIQSPEKKNELMKAYANYLLLRKHGAKTAAELKADPKPEKEPEPPSFTRDKKGVENSNANLIRAVKNNDMKQVQNLLETGNSPNKKDKDGKTAIFYAAKDGNTGILKLLLNSGADINISDPAGHTPLLAAIQSNKPKAVELLLEHGANPNANQLAFTALHFAMHKEKEKQSYPITKLLLKNGANIDFQPLGEETNTVFIDAAKDAPLPYIEFLLKNGADINKCGEAGNTALIEAVIRGKLNVVDLLLKNGAKLNIINLDNSTALDYALLGLSQEDDPVYHIDRRKVQKIIALLRQHGGKTGAELETERKGKKSDDDNIWVDTVGRATSPKEAAFDRVSKKMDAMSTSKKTGFTRTTRSFLKTLKDSNLFPFMMLEFAAKDTKNRVFAVQTRQKDEDGKPVNGWNVIGSGFIINHKGEFFGVTCAHVVDEAGDAPIYAGLNSPNGLSRSLCKIEQLDRDNDVCVMTFHRDNNGRKVETTNQGISSKYFCGRDCFVEGKGIFSIGYPLGLGGVKYDKNDPVFRLGILSQYSGGDSYLIDLTSFSGSSGSLVIILPDFKIGGMIQSCATVSQEVFNDNGEKIGTCKINTGLSKVISGEAIIKNLEAAYKKIRDKPPTIKKSDQPDTNPDPKPVKEPETTSSAGKE